MEEIKVSSNRIALKWGLIFACLGVLGVIFPMLGFFVFIGFFVVVIMAHREFKNASDGFMTFGKGLGIATIITFIGAVFQAIATYFYYSNNPTMFDEIKAKQREILENFYSEEQFEQVSGMMDTILSPTFAGISSLFGTFILFFIFALIITAFTKKENPELI